MSASQHFILILTGRTVIYDTLSFNYRFALVE